MRLSMRSLQLILLTALALLLATIFCGQAMNAQNKAAHRTVLYAGIGHQIIEYDVNLEKGALNQLGAITLPANVQEAWTSPSKKFLYVAWSTRDDSNPAAYEALRGSPNQDGVSTFRIDPASGALTPMGEPAPLPSRPIYTTTDIDGTHVITAENNPSGLTVQQIQPDGTVGAVVPQMGKLDFGIYAHMVRVDPSNQSVILVTRGNYATATKREDPGAIRIFGYKNGVLSPRQTIALNGGFNYQVRHLDFHPSGKWVYVTVERQNKLHVYRRSPAGTLSDAPIFVKDTIADPANPHDLQSASSIHMHPSGKFVYIANRGEGSVEFEGKHVFAGGENTIAVFSINQDTGEPTLIQRVDTHGFSPRTFALDASGSVLAVANQNSRFVRNGSSVSTVPARLSVFHIGADGKLDFTNQYDFESGGGVSLFWTGIVSLP